MTESPATVQALDLRDAQIEAMASSDAAFDGRTFYALGAADKRRYRERSKLSLAAASLAGHTSDTSSVAAPVGVRALEWVSEPPYFVARVPSINAHYAIERYENEDTVPCFWLGGSFGKPAFHDTMAAAKAAAQADYDARIRSALIAPPPPAPIGVYVGRELWLHYDHQVGRWCVEEQQPKVIRTGAEVIHVREVAAALAGRREETND